MKRLTYWHILTAIIALLGAPAASPNAQAQGNFAGNIDRPLRYQPEGKDFVIVNGTRRFNRPLYGVNDAFKVQAGDRPEFALFKDAKYGVLQIGIVTPVGTKWLTDAQTITARYRPGSMVYEISDLMLQGEILTITVLPRSDADGIIVRADLAWPKTLVRVPILGSLPFIGPLPGSGKPLGTLVWCYGGLSGERLQRGGDEIGGGDLAATYALRPSDCANNVIKLDGNSFTLTGPRGTVSSVGPMLGNLSTGDATQLQTPVTAMQSAAGAAPIVVGQVPLAANQPMYFGVALGAVRATDKPGDMAGVWAASEKHREDLANRVIVDTLDAYINASASAYCIAADAIWESPHYMHGANAWRSPLLGWRGPYVADVLGWHDRAATHFSYWAGRQNVDAADLGGVPRPDPAKNLGENDGKTLKSYGAIPAGHYDMALVYIDELLWHYKWTGDTEFLKKTWPTIKLHLAWEKREFDRDGLYEAYAAIWASDAMQYDGGGTAHASAYNYLHFKLAARIAKMMGEDPAPYSNEAKRIQDAMNARLWLPKLGWYAEYKDLMGLKLVHPAAAVYSVYHVIDSEVPDPFQAYEMLRYVDTQIPHIPVQGPGVPAGPWSVVSSSNWLPYQWSLNNVVLAETEHTALAYWQAGRADDAFKLWRGGVLDSMYMGACPGDIPNLSQYDVNRGESYRDFGDAIGIGSRAFIEGLFGILPDALDGELTIRPGFPSGWDHASITTPDISYSFKRILSDVVDPRSSRDLYDTYVITPKFPVPMGLTLKLTAPKVSILEVWVNGKSTKWVNDTTAVGAPVITVSAPATPHYDVVIEWQGSLPAQASNPAFVAQGEKMTMSCGPAHILKIHDPQNALAQVKLSPNAFTTWADGEVGNHTAFAQVKQGDMTWWMPINFAVRDELVFLAGTQDAGHIRFRLQNNSAFPMDGNAGVTVGPQQQTLHLHAPARGETQEIVVPTAGVLPGVIPVQVSWEQGKSGISIVTSTSDLPLFPGRRPQYFPANYRPIITDKQQIVNWQIPAGSSTKTHWDTIDMTAAFNDRVPQIFKNNYLSPRSPYTSLQIPIHAIGSWSSPTAMADIDDSGLRRAAGPSGIFHTPQGIPFRTPGDANSKNIAYTSQWDNYPRTVTIPLSGKSPHAYLLMAGSTAAMQSRLDNGEVIVTYTDGTSTRLALNNPINWWPIDTDYHDDDYAFKRDGINPPRVSLRTGDVYIPNSGDRGSANGGAATVLDLPLDPTRTLKSLTVGTLANDVVIGLMSVTLARQGTPAAP